MSAPQRTHRRGKAVVDGVLNAAVNELLNTGFEGVTIASVAEAAGVHVTSVYRRWKTKEQLITDALLSHIDIGSVTVPDTGALRTDLIELAISLRDSLSSPQSKALLRLATMSIDFDRLDEARRRLVDDRMTTVGVILERAETRGEITGDVDRRIALESLYAPIYARLLLTHQQVDEEYLSSLVDLLVSGIAPR